MKSKESPDCKADDYSEFYINTPFDHPFDALKSHNIQFGVVLGVFLGGLANSGIHFSIDSMGVSFEMGSMFISSVVGLSIAMYAIGFDSVGPIQAADDGDPEGDGDTVGTVQIRKKPHYVVTPMVLSWSLVVILGLVVQILT